MKLFYTITLLIIFSFNLFAEDNTIEKIKLQLQWKYQFQFAGFIMAKENGYYKEIGLDVDILEYKNTNSMQDLEENKIDFAITNSLLAYDDKKLHKVSLIATYFQRSPLIIITQPEIKSILDLKDKTIMISENNRNNSSLSVLLDYFNISAQNTTFLKPSFDINDFIDKRVDAITAFRSNELYILDKQNIPYTKIDPVEYGFTTNSINLFASHDKIKNNPKQINDFLDATKKGWSYALSNIEEVAKLIHEKYQPNKSIEHLIYEGRITKEIMLLNLFDIGEINTNFIEKTYEQQIKSGKIDKDQNNAKLFFQYTAKKKSNELVTFTDKEKEWISKNPIITFSEVNWKPLSIIENNKMKGIMGSYLDIIAKRTGLDFKFIPATSWSDVLQQFEDRKIDIVPGVGSSPQEMKLGMLSKMYAKYPMAIVTGDEFNYVKDLADLKKKTIAVPKYYTSYNFIVKNYPEINLITTTNISEALLLVQENKADAFVGHIAASLYYLSELHLQDLKVSGTTEFNFEHHYLVQKDNPILLSIINKTFDSISYQDRKDIYSQWVQTAKIEKSIDYTLVILITIFFTIIIVLIIFWNIKLKKEVAKRTSAENQLKDTNDKFSALYKLSPLGLALTDMDGKYIEFNDAFQRICGYPKEELKTLDYWKLTPTEYDEAELVQLDMIKRTGAYGPYEKEYIQKDGTYIPINLNGVVIANSEGKEYIWSIVEDITTRKRDEKLLAQQSNLASMGEMIGNIAHQWRQPLSIISTGATGLQIQKEFGNLSDKDFNNFCDAINNNAQYLSQTIDDFKNFIKGDRNKEKFNLTDSIDSFLSLVHGTIKSNNINIILDIQNELEINSYENELKQCFINIFNNAKDALVDTSNTNKYFFITAYQKNNTVIIELKDNGGGIDKSVISRIFEPYFTTKHQKHGTGIGLHMTYNLITSGMQGTIEVNNSTYKYDNNDYSGAIFTICLPLNI